MNQRAAPYVLTQDQARSHVGQGRHAGMGARLGDDRPAVGVADEHDRPVLRVDDPPGRGDVALERQRRILHDADLVVVPGQDVVDALPAGPVHEAAVNEDDVPLGSRLAGDGAGCGHGSAEFMTISLDCWVAAPAGRGWFHCWPRRRVGTTRNGPRNSPRKCAADCVWVLAARPVCTGGPGHGGGGPAGSWACGGPLGWWRRAGAA